MGYAMVLGIECDGCRTVFVIECDDPHVPQSSEKHWPAAMDLGWRPVAGGRRCPRCVERHGLDPIVRVSWREIIGGRLGYS